MKTKAIGYVRVSTDKQADRGVSLEAQVEKIRAMASPFLVLLLLCVLVARCPSRFSEGFSQTLRQPRRYPGNLCRLPLVWSNVFEI